MSLSNKKANKQFKCISGSSCAELTSEQLLQNRRRRSRGKMLGKTSKCGNGFNVANRKLTHTISFIFISNDIKY